MTIKLDRSLALQDKARKIIPGMSHLLSKRPDQFSLGVWPGYFEKARGVEVWDLDGNRYVDMSIGGIGATVLGYADPDVDAAVLEAVRAGSSSSLNCPEEVALAELLLSLHPWADMVRLGRTGGEAMAMAVRIARAATGRDKVAFCGYHGWHDWYLAANLAEDDALQDHLLPGLSPTGVPRGLAGTAFPFHYNRLDELTAIVARHRPDLAAIVMEPIRTAAPEPGFLEGVRHIADDIGAVLIVDEISAGFRLNSGGAHLPLGLTPDLAVFSKALGNGYAIAAILGRGSIMTAVQETFMSSTNWTERIGPAAALAMVQKHRQVDAGRHLVAMGEMVQSGWRSLAEKHGLTIHVGGIPPLSHFSFEAAEAPVMKAFYVQEMLERGFLASTSFYAMWTHAPLHVQVYLAALDEVWHDLVKYNRDGSLLTKLQGQPARPGFARLT